MSRPEQESVSPEQRERLMDLSIASFEVIKLGWQATKTCKCLVNTGTVPWRPRHPRSPDLPPSHPHARARASGVATDGRLPQERDRHPGNA